MPRAAKKAIAPVMTAEERATEAKRLEDMEADAVIEAVRQGKLEAAAVAKDVKDKLDASGAAGSRPS